MFAVRRFSEQIVRTLPLAVLWLGLAGLATSPTPMDKTVATPEMNTREVPPVYVVVSTTQLGGEEVEYSYEVINGGAIPISAIAIGESLYGSQLLTWPIGASPDSIPQDCYSSPTGWEFTVVTTEEQATKYLYWDRTSHSYEILGGQRLGGFAVKLPHADALYETCSWTAFLTDGDEYEGVLQNVSSVTIPPSSIDVHEGVIVSANPGSAVGIRFLAPSAWPGTVDVFDAQGRHVKRLFEGPVKKGWNDFEWKGDNEAGAKVSSGAYFLKIEAGPRLRFARVVLVH